jgi:hypothetical protein
MVLREAVCSARGLNRIIVIADVRSTNILGYFI